MTFRCDKLVRDLIDIITLSGESWRQTQGFTGMARHLGISIAVLLVIGSSITLASEHDHKVKLFTGKKNSSITVDMVVDYLIHKYSTEESVLSFEGYENLLQHLDLGMVDNHHSEEANLNAPSAQSLDYHENHHDHQRHFDIGPIDMQGKQQKLHLHCFQYNHDKETSNPEGSKKHTDNGYQSNQADHHDHGHHADHGDHDDHKEHGGHGDDTEHDHTDHGNHSSHNDHNDHHDDGDHSNHAGHTGDHDDDNDDSDHDQSDHGTHTDHDHTDNEDRGNHSDDQADHSDHGAHTDHDHTDHGVHGNQGAHTDHDHADHGNHGAHNDHNHTDHGDHSDHGAHTGHDHTDHGDHGNHGAHTDHDHTDHGDHGNQGAHTDHDHADHGNQGAHNDHDHTDHGDHRDHGAHTDHDHTDHGDHGNHGAHTDLDHTDHEDHGNHSDDQADHSDHGAHTDHDHGIHSDHTGHDHRDHDDDNSHSDHTVHNHTGHGDHSDHDHTEHSGHEDDSDFARVKRSLEKAVEKTHQRDLIDFRNTCLRPKEILQLMRFSDNALTKEQFIELCPLLIVQLDGHACDHSHDHHHVHSHGHEVGKSNVNYKTWLYACGSIVVISLSGLICVGVLSLLHHMFVQNFLHFLVAMAVGALTGDAMLHLLPHALSSSDGHDHGSGEAHGMDGVFKGLAGLSIFYFFFLFGRIQDIASIRKMKKRKQQTEDLESIGVTMVIRAPDEEGNMVMDRVVNVKEEEANAKEPLGHSHGHSHSHGHDDLPTSTGAMVWRVIVGDGIHNFSDGLAIGVAFADSVTSGLSTAIAVLCHELPHEIGDFAVLLKKGMSIRQALGFNCLSSALSMIGVLVGVAMGNITGIKFYILVCVAGMFIYISLVDMLPEISSSPTQKPVRNLVFTMMGICVGSGIMLAIALKEDELAMITA